MKHKIERNYHNGGLCCCFDVDGNHYFADLCVPMGAYYTECMIFKTGADYQLTLSNARELYCKRDIPITEKQLAECIEEFIKELKDGKGNRTIQGGY